MFSIISFFLGLDSSLDIIFVVDGSAGVSEKLFSAMKQYVYQQVTTYNLSKDKIRVAFSTLGNSRQYSGLANGINNRQVFNILQALQRSGGPRKIDVELANIDSELSSGEFRSTVGKLVVLILAGRNFGGSTLLERPASALRGMR